MARVYSALFVDEHAIPSTEVIEYDFPEGFLYVVREISAFGANTVAHSVQAYDDQNCTFWKDDAEAPSPGTFSLFQGRQVFVGGTGKLFLTGAGVSIPVASFDFRVSGYQLTLP